MTEHTGGFFIPQGVMLHVDMLRIIMAYRNGTMLRSRYKREMRKNKQAQDALYEPRRITPRRGQYTRKQAIQILRKAGRI